MYRTPMPGLFVCLLMGCFSGETLTGSEPDSQVEWTAANEAGAAFYKSGAYADALSSFEKCWTLSQTPPTRGTAAGNTAATLHAMGRDQEARLWFERAIEIWRAIPGRSDEIARSSLGLEDAERGLGDFKAAEQTLRAAINAQPSSPDFTAQLKNRLADLAREQGRNEEARRQLSDALALPGTSRLRQIESLVGIADLDRQMMRWNDSIAGWKKALSAAQEEGSVTFEALALRGLGLTYLNVSNLAQAEPLMKRSLALFEQYKETPRQQLANALHCLASVYLGNRKYTLAEDALLRGLAYLKQEIGEDHPQSAILMESLAETYAADNHFAEARQYAAHAYATMRGVYGETSVPAAEALGTIAEVEQYSRDLPAAAADYELALKVMRRSQAVVDQRTFVLLKEYAIVLTELHRKREATQLRTEIKAFQMR